MGEVVKLRSDSVDRTPSFREGNFDENGQPLRVRFALDALGAKGYSVDQPQLYHLKVCGWSYYPTRGTCVSPAGVVFKKRTVDFFIGLLEKDESPKGVETFPGV